MILRASGLLGAMALIATTSPAIARPVATTQLVSCDEGDCLLVRGQRGSPQAIVRINERPVETHGGTSWQVRLPLATVRAWSAPFARTLRIAVTDPAGAVERSDAVRLPVGMLGAKTELASLIVRAR